jgi:hypothetical protein
LETRPERPKEGKEHQKVGTIIAEKAMHKIEPTETIEIVNYSRGGAYGY